MRTQPIPSIPWPTHCSAPSSPPRAGLEVRGGVAVPARGRDSERPSAGNGLGFLNARAQVSSDRVHPKSQIKCERHRLAFDVVDEHRIPEQNNR